MKPSLCGYGKKVESNIRDFNDEKKSIEMMLRSKEVFNFESVEEHCQIFSKITKIRQTIELLRFFVFSRKKNLIKDPYLKKC